MRRALSHRGRAPIVIGCLCAAAATGSALPPPPPPTTGGSDVVKLTRAKPLPRSMARMEFSRTFHDFGAMMDNEVHETTFEFTNTGSDPLEIININAECGCTVPELEKKLYMPGESGSLLVTLNPEGKSGAFERRVNILTNDASGMSTIVIAADVTPIVEIAPKIVTVGTTDRRTPITKLVTVTGRTDDFEVTSATPRATEDFSARVLGTETTTNRKGERIRRSTIEVTFTPTEQIGDYNAQIEIATNDPRRPTVRTQLIARVRGDLYNQPRFITMRGVRVGEPVTRTIRLANRTGEAFEVLGAELSEGNFSGKASAKPVDPAKRDVWEITLEATPSVVESRITQELIVRTNAKGEEQVSISLRGVVRDGE